MESNSKSCSSARSDLASNIMNKPKNLKPSPTTKKQKMTTEKEERKKKRMTPPSSTTHSLQKTSLQPRKENDTALLETNYVNKNSKVDYYPLGGNLFGYIQRRAGKTTIHVRHFEYSPSKAKTVKTRHGVSMNLMQYKMLCRMKSNLVKDCKTHVLCQQIPSVC